MMRKKNNQKEMQEINQILSKYRKEKKNNITPIVPTLDEVKASLDDCRRILGIKGDGR